MTIIIAKNNKNFKNYSIYRTLWKMETQYKRITITTKIGLLDVTVIPNISEHLQYFSLTHWHIWRWCFNNGLAVDVSYGLVADLARDPLVDVDDLKSLLCSYRASTPFTLFKSQFEKSSWNFSGFAHIGVRDPSQWWLIWFAVLLWERTTFKKIGLGLTLSGNLQLPICLVVSDHLAFVVY